MVMAWSWRGHGMVHGHVMIISWSWHGHSMVIAWSWHDHSMVMAWSWHGHGHGMVISWSWHGHGVVMAWSWRGHACFSPRLCIFSGGAKAHMRELEGVRLQSVVRRLRTTDCKRTRSNSAVCAFAPPKKIRELSEVDLSLGY